ncbi:unnamed protein product [Callosobruchus maculatus]|uniref:Hflx-type G domain-containing protein n=1 Tax=Callosobruchus maculatus TaxID=64391 RepID=A0A653DBP9_CALMS|nr:unnamed protein product [Callosobruchus maculatus]
MTVLVRTMIAKFSFTRSKVLLRTNGLISKLKSTTRLLCSNSEENNGTEYDSLVDSFFRLDDEHKCLVIQPFVKWGPQKLTISPEEQVEEAVALVKTLPRWTVEDTIKIPLESLDRKALFKSGNLDKLTKLVRSNNNISAVFINFSNLKRVTSRILYDNFRVPILDRYKIVMRIFKIHATSKHAKLQVALAELYCIRSKAQQENVFFTHDPEKLKLMFDEREQKLKSEIQQLRTQRDLLRSKRRKLDYPVVAVVGYTNAGKTCLIKSLTGEETLQPKNQLFATLDVTVHSGTLPSGLKVLYVDTVGFLSDLPTNLIECFVATLEDAVLADIILHVEDISSTAFEYKRNHVLKTLKSLDEQVGTGNILNKIVNVGNKCDIVRNSEQFDMLLISAKKGIGLEQLRMLLENRILEVTGRKRITIKIENGGEEMRWLYKNSTILSEAPDDNDMQHVKVEVIITEANLNKFKHYFVKS